MSTQPQELKKEDLIGKLCILDFEMPVTEALLNSLGRDGSHGLDELFEFSVSYSTTLLSSIPAFYQKEVDFPVVVDQILGTLYKHPKKWKQLIKTLKSDPELVTIYVCPVSGVPKIITSEEVFKIKVNDLQINMKATGLSRLSRITHQNVSQEDANEALEYINDIGFIGAMIEDMNRYVANLFMILSARQDDVFFDFIQDLVLGKEVSINLDPETGDVEVIHTESSLTGDLSDSDEETLQELLGDNSEEEFDEFMDSMDLEDDFNEDLDGIDGTVKASTDDDTNQASKEVIFGEFKVSKEDMKSDHVFFLKGNNTIN